MDSNTRTFTFLLSTDCTHCGTQMAVNGPTSSVTCTKCLRVSNVTPQRWASTVAEASQGSMVLGDPYECRGFESPDPRCGKCDSHFPYQDSWTGRTYTVACPLCGEPTQTFPVPQWLRQALPHAVQVVGAESESQASSSDGVQVDDDAMQPVLFQCPGCSGSLDISKEVPRVSGCQYCGAQVFIPDALWFRMHPVKVRRPWTIAYQGADTLVTADVLRQHQASAQRKAEAEALELRDRDLAKMQGMAASRDRLPTLPRLITKMLVLWPILALALSVVVLVPRCMNYDLTQGLEGHYLCPKLCSDCEGPTRVVTVWTQIGRSEHSSDGPQYFCPTPTNGIAGATSVDLQARARAREMRPWELSPWAASAATFFLLLAGMGPLFLIALLLRRMSSLKRRRWLDNAIASAAHTLNARPPRPRRPRKSSLVTLTLAAAFFSGVVWLAWTAIS